MNLPVTSRRGGGVVVMVTLSLLVAMATSANVTVPRVEPELTAARSLLSDIATAVRDATWPTDGGFVAADPTRRQLEADSIALGRTLDSRSLTVTTVTPELLRLTADATTGLAVSQPLAPMHACLVWRSRPPAAATGVRDGLYFLTVFHSSVWSVLLLCLLCVISALTVLDSLHPIGMPKPLADAVKRRSRSRPLGAFHALGFTAGALVLLGYPRGPKGTSSRVLALFWWLFAFTVSAAYLSATVLVFLTTRSLPDAAAAAGVAEVLTTTGRQTLGRVLCSGGNPICADAARPEPLVRANFSLVESDSAGLQQLLVVDQSPPMLLTHQFACANLLAVDTNRTYSVAIVAKAIAWVSLAGPSDLVRQADGHILSLLSSGQMVRLDRQHGMDSVEVYGSSGAGVGGGGVSDWLAELRLGLPYRIGSLYGPLILLMVGFALCLVSAVCEFCYYRFFLDPEDLQLEAEKLEQKERAFTTFSGTMDTYL